MSNSRSLAKLPAFLSPAGVLSPQAGGTGTTSLTDAVNALNLTVGEDVQAWHSTLDAIIALQGTTGLLQKTGASSWTLNTNTYLTGITGSQVTGALGFTPYNATNPAGYISGITGSQVTGALGYTPYNATNPSGYISGITGSNVTTALGYTPENSALKGTAGGYASLDGSGLVPALQLPSYVDDVLEYANLAAFPVTGTTGKIYVALDTNKTYRWSGSAYVYITSGAVDSVAGKTGVVSLTNADVGLGNVENKSSATIRSEITSANVTTALGFTPYNSSNPSGYITSSALTDYLTSATAASTYQPIGAYLTGITSSQVTTALGFTPYNSSNPSGYITSSALTGYLTSSTAASTYLPLTGGTLSGAVLTQTAASSWGVFSKTSGYDNHSGIWFSSNVGELLLRNAAGGLVTRIAADGSYAFINNNNILHAGNYTSYSPSLTGSGASGTWGINVTGNAATATTATNQSGGTVSATSGTFSGSVTVGSAIGGSNAGNIYVNGNHSWRWIAGYAPSYGVGNGFGLYSDTLGAYFLSLSTAGNWWFGSNNHDSSYRVSINGTGYSNSDFRAPIFYDSDNTGYYLDPSSTSNLNTVNASSFNGTINGMSNGGNNISGMGTASTWDARPQGIYDRYAINYHTGISLSGYPSYGGVRLYSAGYPTLNSSVLRLEASSGVYTYGQFTNDSRVDAPVFYDYNDTSYYVNPNSSSYLYSLTLSGAAYFYPNNWIGFSGDYGIYNNTPSGNGAHFLANQLSTYGSWRIIGYRSSYGGIYDTHSGVNIGMFDSAGNGGFYREANGRWYQFYNVANDCTGFGTSSTASAYNIWCGKGIYSDGRIDGTIFYDSNNTAYYLDAANSASAGALSLNGGITFGIANPYLTASSYFIAPGGAFFNSGTVYIQSPLQARGGINNDSAAALVLTGGTGGYTEINGSTRSPIFYDLNNTDYYVDPASTTVLNTVNVNALNIGGQPVTAGGGGSSSPLSSALGYNLV